MAKRVSESPSDDDQRPVDHHDLDRALVCPAHMKVLRAQCQLYCT